MTNQTTFFHNVYFWLNNNDDAQALANGCHKHLSGIPGVARISVGFPAGTERSVVDNSYGVALLVEFANAEAQNIYQEHPDHLRFISECSKYWKRVQVFDTVA